MSESTNDSSSTSAGNEGSTAISDILDHLPPEVAAALGRSKDAKPAEPAPMDAEEETDEAEETETPEQSAEEETDEEATEEEQSDEEADKETDGADNKGRTLEKLEKRIDRITRKRREAETALEELREEHDRLKGEFESRAPIRLEPTPEDPLADIETADDLESKVSAAKKVRSWALANPDGATVTNADGSERYVDRAEMAKFIAQTDALLTDHAPARREYLRERDAILPEARATYPDLFKPGTQAYQVMVDTLKRVPALKRLPGYKMVIGDSLLGMQLRMERAAKSKEATATKSAPTAGKSKAIAPAIPKPSASRPPNSTGKEKGRNLDRVIAGGGIDDLANYFAAA
jgi:flagellar motor protein MotB